MKDAYSWNRSFCTRAVYSEKNIDKPSIAYAVSNFTTLGGIDI